MNERNILNPNDLLRYIILIGIFALPFIAFIVARSMFFPFITGKAFVFRIIVELIFFSWIVLAVRDKEYRPKSSWLIIAFYVFAGVMALSTIFSANPSKSFWSNNERMEGYITILHLFAYFIVAGSVLNTRKLWIYFLNTFVVSSVLMSFYGILQFFGAIPVNQGGVRVDATFGNATYLAIYLLVNIFLSIFLLFVSKGQKWLKIFYGVAIAVQLFVLYHTATRGAILGLIAGLFVTALLLAIFEKENKVIKKTAIGTIVAVFVVVGGFLIVRNADFVKNSPVLGRFSSISATDATTKSRFMIWGMALQGVKERPVFGWGQESFNYVFNKHYNPAMYGQEQWFDRTHNVILDWAISGGILGLLSYLSFFALSLYFLWKKETIFSVTERSVFTGMLVAYFFNNLFVFDNLLSYILFFSFLAYLHSVYSKRKDGSKIYSLDFNQQTKDVIVPTVAGVLVILFMFIFNWGDYMANTTMIEAMKPQQKGVSENLSLFKKALAYNSFASPEIREQLPAVTVEIFSNEGVSQDLKKYFFDLTYEELLKQIDLTPNDARKEYFLGSFLNRFGMYQEAINHLTKALELSPNKQAMMFELASSYVGLNQPEKVFEILKKAYDLAPAYTEARINYAVGAALVKNYKLANEIVETLPKNIYWTDNRILTVFASAEEYSKVVEIWKYRIDMNPDDFQAYFSLASTYVEMGDKSSAIAELRKISERNPQYKDQIEGYVKDVQAGKSLIQ